jgi:hypothetical protein
MKIETHYPLAYFYADTFEGECTFELSVDEDNDLIVTISTAVAYRSDLEIELEHLLTEYDLQLIATEIYDDLLNSDLHEEITQADYNTKLQNAYDNGKNSRRDY